MTGSQIGQPHDESLPDGLLFQKIARLSELAVDTLVCGAISRPAHDMITAHDIRVIPFVAGTLDEIIQAFLLNQLQQDRFAMPGCYGRWRRRTYWCGVNYSEEAINMSNLGFGQDGQGSGQGGGQGRGQGMEKAEAREARAEAKYNRTRAGTRQNGWPAGGRPRRRMHLPEVRTYRTAPARTSLRGTAMLKMRHRNGSAINNHPLKGGTHYAKR